MRVHVVPHAGALRGLDLSRWTVVVIDAVRASSTIAQAVASGCYCVAPAATIPEARAKRKALGTEGVLLCGERRGLRIPGFDLGNSPREYTPEAVRCKTVIITTTNGTRAIRASQGAREVVIGAFLNLEAVAEYLNGAARDVLCVPVGREGAPVLDDVVCAGMYVDRLMELGRPRVTGEAHLARIAYLGFRGRIADALRDSPSGYALVRAGLEEDLPYCAQVGVLDVVPRVVGGEIK